MGGEGASRWAPPPSLQAAPAQGGRPAGLRRSQSNGNCTLQSAGFSKDCVQGRHVLGSRNRNVEAAVRPCGRSASGAAGALPDAGKTPAPGEKGAVLPPPTLSGSQRAWCCCGHIHRSLSLGPWPGGRGAAWPQRPCRAGPLLLTAIPCP